MITSLRLLDTGDVLVTGGMSSSWAESDAYIALLNDTGERMWQQWPPKYPEGVNPSVPGKTFQIVTASGKYRVQEHGRLDRLAPDKNELIATQPDMAGPLPARCIILS